MMMRNIRIIALNTFSQLIRMKVAVIVILLLLALIPFMAVQAVGDGTLLGKLQTFSSYGISLVSLLLCMLTITLSCYALSSDIRNKQIFSLATKPVQRYEILLGKFGGVMIVNLVFLLVFGSISYFLTVSLPKYTEADAQELEQVEDEFFNARTGVTPKMDETKFREEARKEYSRLRSEGQVPQDKTMREYINEYVNQKKYQAVSVAAGEMKDWTFTGLNPQDKQNGSIYLRFKYEASTPPPDNMIAGRWLIGDKRQLEQAKKVQTPIYDSYVRKDAVKTFHEIKIPASVVPEDGQLTVEFQNLYFNKTTVIPREIELLYKSGSFGMNYFKANVLILIRLFFLAAMGIFLTTWLSFPVAIFVSLVVYFTGMVNGFIVGAIDSLTQGVGLFYMFTVKPLLHLLPSFDGQSNPSGKILSARMIGSLFLLEKTGITIILKSGGLLAAGALVFNRRELAKVTV
ncbi:ABC transporter permease [Sedimentisphaera salicampi]|nr:ABC transporter permease [Sedimentisphaera salicampi]